MGWGTRGADTGNRATRRRRSLASGVAALATAALVVGFALTGCTSSAAPAGPPQPSTPLPQQTSKQLEAAVRSAMKLAGASGAIAGVWAPWSGAWTAGIGTTTTDGSQPMTTGMHFRIGSITKSMTCTVLLGLVDDGTVKLDDPVTKYLPRVVGIDGVTLGQLCSNTSGMGDYDPGVVAQFTDNPTRSWVPMELMSDGLAQPSSGSPGAKWSYSNSGFMLLGMALDAATGSDWDQLYKKYVFQPLGMSGTSLPSESTVTLPSPSPHGYATPLDAATAAPKCGTRVDDTQLSPSMGWTSAGIVSDLDDLKTFAQAFATGSPFSPASAKAQWTTIPLPGTGSSWQSYGLGGVQLGPFRGHDGEVPGFVTSMLSDPKTGLTVVVMLNDSTSGADFAQLLSMQLASIATKAPAASGKKAPSYSLPWSSDQAATALASAVTCPPAPAKGAKPAQPPAAPFAIPPPDN